MRDFVRRHPFWSFYLLACLLASLVAMGRFLAARQYSLATGEPLNYYALIWKAQERLGIENINVLSLLRMSVDDPAVRWSLPYPASVSIAAMIIAFWLGGRSGLWQLLQRFKPWREGVTAAEGLRAYAVIMAIFGGFTAYFALVSWVHGGQAGLEEIAPRIGANAWLVMVYFLVGTFLREGGLLEELGWRGFALPLLMERMSSPLAASILLGILWTVWHIPRDVSWNMLSLPAGQYLLFLVMFSVVLIGTSIIITYFFNRTGGSVWPAIMIHGLYVHMSSGLAYETLSWKDYGDLRAWPVLMLAFVILWIAGPELGRRKPAAVD